MDYVSFLVRTAMATRDAKRRGGQRSKCRSIDAVFLASEDSNSPTPRAASRLKHTIWQSAAWWARELNRLPGLAWRENFSVIGRAQSALEKSLSFLSTMPALLVLCSCGRRSYWVPLKSRARRASWQTRLTSSAVLQ